VLHYSVDFLSVREIVGVAARDLPAILYLQYKGGLVGIPKALIVRMRRAPDGSEPQDDVLPALQGEAMIEAEGIVNGGEPWCTSAVAGLQYYDYWRDDGLGRRVRPEAGERLQLMRKPVSAGNTRRRWAT
jgi:hypothetical protein